MAPAIFYFGKYLARTDDRAKTFLEYFRELGTIHEKFPPRGRLNSVYVRYDENLIKFTWDNLVPSKLSIWKLFLLLAKCMRVY